MDQQGLQPPPHLQTKTPQKNLFDGFPCQPADYNNLFFRCLCLLGLALGQRSEERQKRKMQQSGNTIIQRWHKQAISLYTSRFVFQFLDCHFHLPCLVCISYFCQKMIQMCKKHSNVQICRPGYYLFEGSKNTKNYFHHNVNAQGVVGFFQRI